MGTGETGRAASVLSPDALELVAFVAGEPHSDHPECVCPVLGAFIRVWNDALPDDERDAILKPILPRLIGTADRPFCACGCGELAPLAQRTHGRKGEQKGKPLRFISGHNRRNTTDLSRYEKIDGGYSSPCWRWTGPLNRKGYGYVQIGGVHKNAHRALYEAENGTLPRSLHVDHLCRNKWCVNPSHGEPVTPLENERRKRAALAAELLDGGAQ